MKKLWLILAGMAFVLAITFILHAQTSSDDLQVMMQAVESTTPTPAADVPETGTFHSAQNPDAAPSPADVINVPAWSLGDGFWLLDDLDYDYTPPRTESLAAGRGMSRMSLTDDLEGDDLAPAFSFPTNSLWLQITNVADGLAYVNLMNATDSVYEIWSKTDLTLTNWNIELELWPTNQTVMPFTAQEQDRTNLFLWARDWTGITSNGNETPEWWFWKYFGTVDLADTDLDSQGNTLSYDYANDIDPNIISFSLSFTNQYVNADTINATIAILGGVPSYMAVLVNDTNQADAVWQPCTSSNIVATLGSTDGTYTVSVGLRGLPAGAMQTWQSQIVFKETAAPVLAITNPASGTVSVPLIQLQGLADESLGSLTYDVSNALGVVTNQPGYWQPAFYDTNQMEFTTNSFQCYDIPLTNGVNVITLHATDLAGNMTTTDVIYTLDYSGDTTAPVLSVLWPTNGTVIGGSNFTMQAQVDDDTATVTASITDTNGDTNTVQGLVERSGAVWFDGLPLNGGTNWVTITAVDAAGNAGGTSLAVIQSAVNMTIDPLMDDNAPNQASVTVTGNVGDESDNITVNGVAAYFTDDAGDWEADSVAVNPTGTASLDVEVTDAVGNPLASQVASQVQPAGVVISAYDKDYESSSTYTGWCVGDGGGPTVFDDEQEHWISGKGLDQTARSSWDGECGDPVTPGGEVTDLSGYTNDLPVPWENVLASAAGANNSTRTKVAILPSGQQPIGQTALYLVMAQVMDEDTGLQLPGSEVQIQETTLTDVTNSDGSIWSGAIVSAPAGAMPDVTPQTSVKNISFSGMKVYQLVSQCVATTPVNQSRTNLGVGEQVNLSFNPPLLINYTNITWSATAGGLLYTNGNSTFFTAPSNAANVTVTAKVGSHVINLNFQVLEPSGVNMVTNGLAHLSGRPDIGMHTLIYLAPDSVNFGRIWCQEEQAYAVANGVYASFNGFPHEAGPTPFQFSSTVVSGLGTLIKNAPANGDNIYSGNPTNAPPFTPGTEVYTIPWDFQVGGTSGTWKTNFTTLTGTCSLGTGGVLTASKAGASWSCNVTNASVTYPYPGAPY